jgi:hypothetical protein
LTDLSASGIALDYVGVAVKKEKAMGMDIPGRDWDFRCSATFWEECLSLAEAFGWERAGTVAPLLAIKEIAMTVGMGTTAVTTISK